MPSESIPGSMAGVFPILVTPFDDKGRIDEVSLRQLVDFNIDAGVHGLGVALGSEIFKLSEAERDEVTNIVVSQVRQRAPVVINTACRAQIWPCSIAAALEELGADALMIIPPNFLPAGPAEVLEYYQAISDSVQVPIFLQDVPAAPISVSLAREIAEKCEYVRYIKVETVPITARVAEMVSKAGSQLTVFGGAGGGFFIEELRRGSMGTMPFCSQPEAFVQVWRLVQSGDEAAARAVFDQVIAPVNRLATQGVGIFYHIHKELLRQRGVIATSKVRSPAPPIEQLIQMELQDLIGELYPAGAG